MRKETCLYWRRPLAGCWAPLAAGLTDKGPANPPCNNSTLPPRVLFEQLVCQADALAARALAFLAAPEPSQPGAAAGRARKGAKSAPPQLGECADSEVDAVVSRLMRLAEAFGGLVEMSKAHSSKTGLLSQARAGDFVCAP